MTYTHDWSGSREHWPELFAPLMERSGLNVLEVGCYEGQATRWLLDNLPECVVQVVDTFDQYAEQFATFSQNVNYPTNPRVRVVHGPSQDRLPVCRRKFDVVYIDGDHSSAAVLTDAVDVLRLTRPGGWMLFDDYDFTGVTPGVVPAVHAFVACCGDLLAEARRVGRDQFLCVVR